MKHYFLSYMYTLAESPGKPRFDSAVTTTHPFTYIYELTHEGFHCTILSFQEITKEEYNLHRDNELNAIL